MTPESGTSPESLLSTSSFTVPEIDPRFGTLGTALTLGTLDGEELGRALILGLLLGTGEISNAGGPVAIGVSLGRFDGDKEGLVLPVGSSLGNADGYLLEVGD